MAKLLINSDLGISGVYKAILLEGNKVYVPGITNFSLSDGAGSVNKDSYEKHIDTLPVAWFCAFNRKCTENDLPASCWVTFECGDVKRPIILGFQGKSIKSAIIQDQSGEFSESSGSSSGGGMNSSIVVSGDISGALTAMNQLASGGYAYGRGTNKYDCSSAVSWALVQAGIIPGSHEDYWTGNMVEEYTKHGFVVVNVSTANSSQLQPGDVLISNSHAAMYMGDGKMTYSNSKKGNGIGGYYNFSPHTVLRYKG